MKNTALEKLKKHIDDEVALGFLDKKYSERLKWYIDNFFLKIEEEQIMQALNDGKAMAIHSEKNKSLEQYYKETYGKDA